MTDIMFTRTALAGAAEKAGVTADQARIILEAAGVKVQPEKPDLPTKPGSVILATEVRGVKGEWRMMLARAGDWCAGEVIDGLEYHRPRHITAWTPARVVPVATTPVTLTEDQALALRAEVDPANRSVPALPRELATKFANAVLAKYAAPAEDMPDWDDVRNAVASQRGNGWSLHDPAINGITDAVMRLLHREEA